LDGANPLSKQVLVAAEILPEEVLHRHLVGETVEFVDDLSVLHDRDGGAILRAQPGAGVGRLVLLETNEARLAGERARQFFVDRNFRGTVDATTGNQHNDGSTLAADGEREVRVIDDGDTIGSARYLMPRVRAHRLHLTGRHRHVMMTVSSECRGPHRHDQHDQRHHKVRAVLTKRQPRGLLEVEAEAIDIIRTEPGPVGGEGKRHKPVLDRLREHPVHAEQHGGVREVVPLLVVREPATVGEGADEIPERAKRAKSTRTPAPAATQA